MRSSLMVVGLASVVAVAGLVALPARADAPAVPVAAAPRPALETLPLDQIHPGMIGVGRTVFEGSRIEEFKVTVIVVLENVGPKQSMIVARLEGGPLEKTGVI